jgi:hypothetical protein
MWRHRHLTPPRLGDAGPTCEAIVCRLDPVCPPPAEVQPKLPLVVMSTWLCNVNFLAQTWTEGQRGAL